MTRIGPKRRLIVIQEAVETQAADGSVVQTWTDYSVLWAEILPVTGRESFTAQTESSTVTYKVRTRYVSGITTKMRVAVGDERVLDIEAVIDPDERNRELLLLCSEGVE